MRAPILAFALLVACGPAPATPDAGPGFDAGAPERTDAGTRPDAGWDGGGLSEDGGAPAEDAGAVDAGPEGTCVTRVTYGSAWIHAPSRTTDFDEVDGVVTWDGVCHPGTAGNSYARLSNGWEPYFEGPSGCVIALDVTGDCADAPPDGCRTRVTYGDAWQAPASHPERFDEVSGVVTWSGACPDAGASSSRAVLSNGWEPHFEGRGACALGFRHTQCGGLYANPVVDVGCADPGVAFDAASSRYVMACTSGNAAAAFPLRTSPDLVAWTRAGHAFPSGTRPSWGTGDFWAPEIHRVGDRWVVYFSARTSDGSFALGAGTADDPLGPYVDVGAPILSAPHPGVIDAHFFEAPDGTRYLLWKVDGNAVGARTPIYIQRLEADGVTLRGARTEILTNDRAWEGPLVEAPWMIHRGGQYFLFYSANGFATTRYGVGVARSDAPTGPFTKLADPILVSNGAFSGPGHGSVLRGPRGDWVHVYHAWLAGRVGESPGRVVLVDRIAWRGGWPRMSASPNPRSQPRP